MSLTTSQVERPYVQSLEVKKCVSGCRLLKLLSCQTAMRSSRMREPAKARNVPVLKVEECSASKCQVAGLWISDVELRLPRTTELLCLDTLENCGNSASEERTSGGHRVSYRTHYEFTEAAPAHWIIQLYLSTIVHRFGRSHSHTPSTPLGLAKRSSLTKPFEDSYMYADPLHH